MRKLLIITLFAPIITLAQEASEKEKLLSYEKDAQLVTEQMAASGYNPFDYLYAGSNIDRKPINKDSLKQIKALYYWSTSCHYCKKELKELKVLTEKNPAWNDQILIAMRVNYQKKEASVKREGAACVLYKGDKEVVRSPIRIMFISEKFGEDIKDRANPHTFIYNTDKELILYKEGYYVSKKNFISELNQKFNHHLLTKYLD